MVVHLGVVVVALGILGSSAFRIDEQIRIDFGATVAFEGYDLTAADSFMERTPGRISAGAIIEVARDGRPVTTLRPRINQFAGQGMNVPTPAVHYTLWHDLYLNIASTVGPESSFVVLRVVKSPLVTWIWIGGVIMALGTLYALTPDRRRVAATRREGVGARGRADA